MGKFSKLISVAAVAAATGAGVYYYLNKSQLESAKSESSEGVSGTGTTAQDSVTDFFREKREQIMNSREYVTLTDNISVAKDVLVKTVTEAAETIKEKAAEVRDGVGVVADDEKDKAENFEFEEFEDADVDDDEAVADEETETASADANTEAAPAVETTETVSAVETTETVSAVEE